MKTTMTITQKNPDAIAFDPLSGLKLVAMASVHLSQTEQPVKVGMTVTHKNYGAGKVVGEWHSIRSGVPCKDIFDVIFQNRSGHPFLHCCRKEYLTPDPLSSPSEDDARRPVRIRNAGRPALRRAPSPARIYGDRLKVGFPFQGITKMIYLDNGPVAKSDRVESLFSGPTEEKRIGLVINPTLEQCDKFSASVEIQDDSLALDRSTFWGLHAGNII
jgi:hypothetical protein